MTTRRLRDSHGHTWPITGRRCPVCSMPTSHEDVHPMCTPTGDVSTAAHEDAVALVEQTLGGEVIGHYTTRWLKSGQPIDPPDRPVADRQRRRPS